MKYTAILLLLLCGCSQDERMANNAHRSKVQAPLSDKAVTSKKHALEDGEITVMQVPVTQMDKVTEHQTCYLWRDKETKNVSLQCPNDRQSYSIDPP